MSLFLILIRQCWKSVNKGFQNLDFNLKTVSTGREDVIVDFVRLLPQPFTCFSLDPHVSFQVGNAEDLADIPSESMDAYTIAFGIRNCTHIDKVIGQAYRVLKPGGRFMCLEFGKVDNPVVGRLVSLWQSPLLIF